VQRIGMNETNLPAGRLVLRHLPAAGGLVAKKLNTIPIDTPLLCGGEFHSLQ